MSEELLSALYLITPNETEAELICGQKITDIDSATKAANLIKAKGVKNVIITMGRKERLFVLTLFVNWFPPIK